MKLYHLLTFLIAMTFIVSGCGPLQTAPQPAATEETFAQPSVTPILSDVVPTEPIQAGNAWVETRDAHFGYAIALPCYWSSTPIPVEGMFAAMTAESYTEEFFAAHSDRGNWKNDTWPEGAMKLDVLVYEGIDPALSLEDAVNLFYAEYSNEQEISSVEDVTYAAHPALLVAVAGGLSGAKVYRHVYFRLEPDKLIWFLFNPDSALDSPDVQVILNSLILPSEGEITLPAIVPSGRPEDGHSLVHKAR